MEENIKLFPIFGTRRRDGAQETLPIDALLPYEERCVKRYGKTFAELANEKGLSYMDLYCLVKDMSWEQVNDMHMVDQQLYNKLTEALGMKQYVVPVEWVVCGYAGVYARNPKEACMLMREDNGHIPVPTSPYMQYVEDTFAVSDYPDNIEESEEMCKLLTDMYNKGKRMYLLNYI